MVMTHASGRKAEGEPAADGSLDFQAEYLAAALEVHRLALRALAHEDIVDSEAFEPLALNAQQIGAGLARLDAAVSATREAALDRVRTALGLISTPAQAARVEEILKEVLALLLGGVQLEVGS